LTAGDIERESQWAHDLWSHSSRGSQHAATGDPNEMKNVRVKQEIDSDTVEPGDIPGECSFVKFYVVLGA
jgi:hypothetical protein